MSLSERIRPNSEAAPWVCEEVKGLESKLDAVQARCAKLEAYNGIGAKRLEHMKEQLAAERARNEKLVRGIRSILPSPPYHPDLEPEWIYLNELVNKGEAAP